MRPSHLALALLVSTVACRAREHVNEQAFRWSDELPAGTTLHLRDLNGGITVRPAADGPASVAATTRWRSGRESGIRFVANRVGNDVYVCALWGDGGRCDATGYRSTTSRPIWKRLLGLLSLRHRTGSSARADFDVALPAGVRIDASTVNGGVQVRGARAGVTAITVNGPVHATGVSGSIALKSVNGPVHGELDSLASGDSARLVTVNGPVELVLPGAPDANLHLSTVNGSIRTDFDLPGTSSGPGEESRRSVRAILGAGTRRVTMTTVNGSVTLRR